MTKLEQPDFFNAACADIPIRDQRDTMERPFFSLAKSHRTAPIDLRERIDFQTRGNSKVFYIAVHNCDVEINGEKAARIELPNASLDVHLAGLDSSIDFNIYRVGGEAVPDAGARQRLDHK